MARHHADDAKPAGKLYPQDRHSRSHPHHDAASGGGREAPDYLSIKESDDPYRILKRAYYHDRQGGSARDYTAPERAPERVSRAPDMDEYRASFADVKGTPVSSPVDEAAPQFRDSKSAHYNDVPSTWVRGMSNQSPHPAFDSGPSGHRYRK